MGGKKRTVRGYEYFLGIHFVICHGPVDSFTQLWFDDRLAWAGDAMDQVVYVNSPYLYGGYRGQGGVYGSMSVLSGKADQAQDSYLVRKLGAAVPAFRGVFSVVFRQMQLGFSSYLKRPSFMVSRIHKTSSGDAQWYDAKAAIGLDMNPAHIIRECLTDRTWGMGYGSEYMGDTFTTVADTLYAEGMGMSMIWNTSSRLKAFIDEVQKHINGALYISRETGKFEIKLIRDDYTIEDLPEFTESNIAQVTNFKRMTIADLTSEVTVIYTDRATGNDSTVTARNLALVNQQGVAVGTRIEYKGFTSRTMATLAANRELKQHSIPLIACTIKTNQDACDLNIGDVIKFSYSPYGIDAVIMRIMALDFGDITDSSITMSCVEDVFGTADLQYTVPPESEWEPIYGEPAPVTNRIYNEMPYWDIVQQMGDTLAEALDEDVGYFGITGEQPDQTNFNAALWVDDDLDNIYDEATESDLIDFCEVTTITADITAGQTVISVAPINNTDSIYLNSYAVIDGEIVLVSTVSSESITIIRGASDTVPAEHSSGASIFFAQDYYGSDEQQYTDSETIRMKLLTRTPTEELDIADASADTLTFNSRQIRPYPPGQFKLNAEYYPDVVDGDVVVSWVDRNRITQSSGLIGMVAGSVTKEVGTTYTCRLRDGITNAIISTTTDITGATHTFTSAVIGSHLSLKVELWAVRDTYDSWQTHEHIFWWNTYQFENGDSYEFENGDVYQFN